MGRRTARIHVLCVVGFVLLVPFMGAAGASPPVEGPGLTGGRSAELQSLAGQGVGGGSFEAPRAWTSPGGFLRFWSTPPGSQVAPKSASGTGPEEVAAAFLDKWRNVIVEGSESLTFVPKKHRSAAAGASVRFVQQYADIPVFAAEAVIQVDGGAIRSAMLDILHDAGPLDRGEISTVPVVTATDATGHAEAWFVAKHGGPSATASEPTLFIFAPAVVGEEGPVRLVWRTDVGAPLTTPIRERVLVDARTGRVVFSYPLVHDAKVREVYDAANTSSDPGVLVLVEGDPPTGQVDADLAYTYLGDTYDFYNIHHGRDSLDDAGVTLSATVRYCDIMSPCPYRNAFWDGARMYFGEGFAAADDVVAHELTHGVTTSESNLIYANQSGAINESLSDIWGEFVDLENAGGTDTPEVRWLVGEDLPGIGAIRDMADPPAYGDPDSMESPFWYAGSADEGGVHTNSGVGNKLCYLLTDGGTFNGYAIDAMGIADVADLFYACQVSLLTPGSDYADLYLALTQAAVDLGWGASEQANLESACRAVRIKPRPEGVSQFTAASTQGDPTINLQWKNPTETGFQYVMVRRATDTYPAAPDDGVEVYNGQDTTFTDAPLDPQTLYYYTAWAFYDDGDYSASSHGQAVAAVDTVDYFTELFDGNDNDLDFKSLTLLPVNSPSFYSASIEPVTDFHVDPEGGTALPMSLDDSVEVALLDGETVSLYGVSYGTFYVGSNGYVTFGTDDLEYAESFADHFALPRVSALFDDLDLTYIGEVSWKQLADRVAVTWLNVPKFATISPNSFQIELFFDGRIRITWLQLGSEDGLAGISAGSGVPPYFFESDLSDYGLRDSDGDGLPDLWEDAEGLDPNDPDGDNGATGDPDDDGLTNEEEYQNGTDPNSPDTDGDGLEDADEINIHNTDPTNADSDGDGYGDGLEVSLGTDPNEPADTPPPGDIAVTDSLSPNDDLAIPFGDVPLGLVRSERVTVTNNDGTNHLLVTGIGLAGEYLEDFGDGLAQEWVEGVDAQWDIVGGEYRADAGFVGVNMQTMYTGQVWDDCVVRATMRRTGDDFATAYLCARASNDFQFELPSGAGDAFVVGIMGETSYVVGRFVSGVFEILDLQSSEHLNLGAGTNIVEMALEGTSVEIRFNGSLAWSSADAAPESLGRVGLVCDSGYFQQTTHYFDDVTVSAQGGVGGFSLQDLPDYPTLLALGESLGFDVVYEPIALAADAVNLFVESNDASESRVDVSLTGQGVPDDLEISPESVFHAEGPLGGPFVPSQMTYTLHNGGPGSIDWGTWCSVDWVEVTPPSGTLASGASLDISVALTAEASTLISGLHSGGVIFSNSTSGAVQTRDVTLKVIGPPPGAFAWFDLDTDPGWSTDGEWAYGLPAGLGGDLYGNPDPASGATGTHVYGVNLNGNYDVALSGMAYLTAGPFDCTGQRNVELHFERWLNGDMQPYVFNTVEVSNDGSSWTTVWDNSAGEVADETWTPQEFDISVWADDQPQVSIRWGHSVFLEDAFPYSGWNIDDIALVSDPAQGVSVWVEFGYLGLENGTFRYPYATLGQALAGVTDNGTITIKGDVPDRQTDEAPLTIDRPIRIEAAGGPVRIGVPGE